MRGLKPKAYPSKGWPDALECRCGHRLTGHEPDGRCKGRRHTEHAPTKQDKHAWRVAWANDCDCSSFRLAHTNGNCPGILQFGNLGGTRWPMSTSGRWFHFEHVAKLMFQQRPRAGYAYMGPVDWASFMYATDTLIRIESLWRELKPEPWWLEAILDDDAQGRIRARVAAALAVVAHRGWPATWNEALGLGIAPPEAETPKQRELLEVEPATSGPDLAAPTAATAAKRSPAVQSLPSSQTQARAEQLSLF